ncbi:MAG: CRISPR-associated endonuclease Cas2 [Bacteroidaceae bacterium]|nr:CRISPR-associated endonuclease Cas2 [Bacteroidaceae bacterium]
MSEVRLNAYRIMWLFVMFDLPTQTKVDKKNSARFRKDLEKDGFIMHQWSVYIRYCASLESAKLHIKRIRSFTPSKGLVSILTITDKQYSDIVNIWGAIEKKKVETPMQLEIF